MSTGGTWLAAPLADAAADRILTAAEQLFAERGPTGVGMAAIAELAGCSRATLYRYFRNRRELQIAFAHREAARIVDAVEAQVADAADPTEKATQTLVRVLAEVRARPTLAAWITPESSAELVAVLRDSPLIEATAAQFTTGSDRSPDPDLARWLLRCLVSLLTLPPADDREERRLVERFVVPLMTGP
jgi:AcrR family transcriptional regulator